MNSLTLTEGLPHRETMPRTLANQLRAWREANNLSQGTAAARLGVTRRSIENWEQGIRTPQGLALQALQNMIQTSGQKNRKKVSRRA